MSLLSGSVWLEENTTEMLVKNDKSVKTKMSTHHNHQVLGIIGILETNHGRFWRCHLAKIPKRPKVSFFKNVKPKKKVFARISKPNKVKIRCGFFRGLSADSSSSHQDASNDAHNMLFEIHLGVQNYRKVKFLVHNLACYWWGNAQCPYFSFFKPPGNPRNPPVQIPPVCTW